LKFFGEGNEKTGESRNGRMSGASGAGHGKLKKDETPVARGLRRTLGLLAERVSFFDMSMRRNDASTRL
jgi:hypothetical protein